MKKVNETTATKAIEATNASDVIKNYVHCTGEYALVAHSFMRAYECGEISKESLKAALGIVISRAQEAGCYDEKAS